MTKLIIFTDLHMLPEGGRIIGLDPHARLAAGIDHVNRHHGDAARVIVTGDLAHRGDAESYARLARLLAGFDMPVSLLIGNHDSRAAFRAAFPGAPVDADGFVQQAIDLPEGRLLLLDTVNDPAGPNADPHAGHLCARRLAWLDARLAEAAGRPCHIFMHHPPVATGFPGMDRIRLADEAAFYALLHRHGAVRHLFAGHVHRTIGGVCRGIPFSIFKSPVHQQPMLLDIDDPTLSVDEPAAYGIVLLGADGVVVHTEDYEIARRDAGSDGAG